jgi:hypothetical protein
VIFAGRFHAEQYDLSRTITEATKSRAKPASGEAAVSRRNHRIDRTIINAVAPGQLLTSPGASLTNDVSRKVSHVSLRQAMNAIGPMQQSCMLGTPQVHRITLNYQYRALLELVKFEHAVARFGHSHGRRDLPERHKFVLDANCVRIADAYLAAVRGGEDRPVVAIIDVDDPLSREMALQLVPHDLISTPSEDEAGAADMGYVWTLSHDQALTQLGSLSPQGCMSIEQLTALDLVPVVVITSGILFWAGLPKPYLVPPRRAVPFSAN